TMGLGAGLVLGSTLAGLTIAALGVLAVGTILMLETSGRIVITESALVVQSGILLRRYERAYIQDARVERVRPLQFLRIEASLFEPSALMRPSEGLRFRYAPPKGRAREAFVSTPDAADWLARLGTTP